METLRGHHILLGRRAWRKHFVNIREKEGSLEVGKGREKWKQEGIPGKGKADVQSEIVTEHRIFWK